MGLVYFLTSLLMIVAACVNLRRGVGRHRVLLVGLTALYAVFCFMAYGRLAGFLPADSIEHIVAQQGFDASSLLVPISTMLTAAFVSGTMFNLLTAAWILLRWSAWKWCLVVVAAFCVVCAGAGPVVGMSPLVSLFCGCCGIMALVGWVLGLTYVEFCVIGNIWVQGMALIFSAFYLLWASTAAIASARRSGARNGFAILTASFAVVQIVAVLAIFCHYIGSMKYAFDTCVSDLMAIAAAFHTTYAMVNIIIFVVLFVLIMAFDIIVGGMLSRRSSVSRG